MIRLVLVSAALSFLSFTGAVSAFQIEPTNDKQVKVTVECRRKMQKVRKFQRTHQYPISVAELLEIIELRKSAWGDNHVNVEMDYAYLGGVLAQHKQFTDAKLNLVDAISIFEGWFRIRHPEDDCYRFFQANALANYGKLQVSTGDVSRGIETLKTVLEMHAKKFVNDNESTKPQLASANNNLGFAFEKLGQIRKAREHYLMAVKLDREVCDTTYTRQFNLASSLINLGSAFASLGEKEEGKTRLVEAKTLLRTSDPAYLELLFNLSGICQRLGQDQEAEEYGLEARDVCLRFLDDSDHELTMKSLQNLASIYRKREQFEKAFHNSLKAADMKTRLAWKFFVSFPESTSINYYNSYMGAPGLPITLKNESEVSTSRTYTSVLKRRGILHRAVMAQVKSVLSASGQRGPYERLVQIDQLMARADIKGGQFEKFVKERESIITSSNRNGRSNGIPELKSIDSTEVVKLLPDDSALVDIVHYLSHEIDDEHFKLPKLRYAAFISEKLSGNVEFVDLGPVEEIDELILDWLEEIKLGSNASDDSVTERIWRPISDKLGVKSKRIYLCCDGMLNQIPWSAIRDVPERGGKFLIQRDFEFISLADPYQLQEIKTESRRDSYAWSGKAVVVNDIDVKPWNRAKVRFGETVNVGTAVKGILKRSNVDLLGFEGLTAQSGPVVEAIRDCENFVIWSHAYVKGVTGEELRNRTKRRVPNWIRGAGGFNKLEEDRFPLQKSGIILQYPDSLSAQLVSSLNLEKIDTAILIGCNTATGDLLANEGVVGFQLALRRAGVATSIGTLWEVNSDFSMLFFEKYQECLRDSKSKIESFRLAQLHVLKNAGGDSGLPKHWAAWSFSGAPE